MESQPISPELYRLLRLNFGSVQLANPGSAMVANRQQTAVPSANGRSRYQILHAGEYYRICCPFCRDSRYRLWVNHMYGQRDERGRRETWLAVCYNEDCLAKYEHRRSLEDKIFGLRNADAPLPIVISPENLSEGVSLRPHSPPGHTVMINQLPREHHAVQYLIGRGFDVDWLADTYRVSYCLRAPPEYRSIGDRIIVPVFMDRVCVGWQSRVPYNLTKEQLRQYGIPKYYTAPTMPKSLVLYNYDVARTFPFIVINEGVTDSWAVGPYSVATLGASLSMIQKSRLLYENQGKPLIFMWDPDARLKMEGVIAEMRRIGTNPIVECMLPDGSDPGNYDQSANFRMIHAAAARQGVTL